MRKHRKKNAFGIRYFQARKNTLLLSAFFLAGLTFGSFYAIADSSDSLVIVSIVINGIRAQSKASYLRLFYQAALPSAAVLIFLYFAANCCKGKLLVSMVPLVYGLSVGAIMTAVLYFWGRDGILYLLLCTFIPKIITLFLSIVLCNLTLHTCMSICSGAEERIDFFLLFALLYAAAAALEALLIHLFCGLLPLGL